MNISLCEWCQCVSSNVCFLVQFCFTWGDTFSNRSCTMDRPSCWTSYLSFWSLLRPRRGDRFYFKNAGENIRKKIKIHSSGDKASVLWPMCCYVLDTEVLLSVFLEWVQPIFPYEQQTYLVCLWDLLMCVRHHHISSNLCLQVQLPSSNPVFLLWTNTTANCQRASFTFRTFSFAGSVLLLWDQPSEPPGHGGHGFVAAAPLRAEPVIAGVLSQSDTQRVSLAPALSKLYIIGTPSPK